MQGSAAPMPGIFDVLQQISQQRPDLSPQQIQQALSQLQPADWEAFLRPPTTQGVQQPQSPSGFDPLFTLQGQYGRNLTGKPQMGLQSLPAFRYDLPPIRF